MPAKLTWKGVLAAALLLYAALWRLVFVGYFNDDALLILAARQLFHSGLTTAAAPPPAQLYHFLPGYPVFLWPFVLLFQPHWALLKLTSMALLLTAGYLFWILLAQWLPPRRRLAALALFAWNPVVAMYSGAVMAEPLFVTLILGVLLLVSSAEERWDRTALLGLLLGWAATARPDGLLLILSLIFLGLGQRQDRSLGKAMILGSGFWVLAVWRSYARTGVLFDYAMDWVKDSRLSALSPGVFGSHARNVVAIFWGEGVGGLSPSGRTLAAGLFLTAVSAAGFYSLWTTHRSARRTLALSGLFCGLEVLLHLFWQTSLDIRYVLPLLPFLIAWTLEGVAFILAQLPRPRTGWVFLGLCAAVSYGWSDAGYLRDAWALERPVSARLPVQTLEWIRSQTSPPVRIGTLRTGTVSLYAQRATVPIVDLDDADTFRYWLIRQHVDYLLLEPLPDLSPRRAALWDRVGRWIRADSGRFSKVYQNAAEATEVYQPLGNDSFKKAFELYAQGLIQLAAGRPAAARKLFSRALVIESRFPAALNAYAASCLQEPAGCNPGNSSRLQGL